MAQVEAPKKPTEVDTPPKQVNIQEGKNTVMPGAAPGGLATAGTPMAQVDESPTKEKVVDPGPVASNDAASRSAPQSPKTPTSAAGRELKHQISPGQRGTNMKAEAFAEAHSKRVETEAQAYIDSEVKKAEAHAQKLQTIAEKERMHEEAKATEALKKEEHRADSVVHNAELKADKIIAQAKEKAVLIKGQAKEVAEKHIAEANTAAEREKAAIEETKARKLAEIKDKAETMIAAGELPTSGPKASVLGKLCACT